MEQLFIGELIRQRRLELGLKQCELCEGICEPVTMSRLESGKQTPGSNKLRMLMQRLGLPEERYYALVSKMNFVFPNCKPKSFPATCSTTLCEDWKKSRNWKQSQNQTTIRSVSLSFVPGRSLASWLTARLSHIRWKKNWRCSLKQSDSPHLILTLTTLTRGCTALMRSRLSTKLPISIPSKANVNKRFKFLFS